MTIKNYTTVVPANRSITEIQAALVGHGTTSMLSKYEQVLAVSRRCSFSYECMTERCPFRSRCTGSDSNASWNYSRYAGGMMSIMCTASRGATSAIGS